MTQSSEHRRPQSPWEATAGSSPSDNQFYWTPRGSTAATSPPLPHTSMISEKGNYHNRNGTPPLSISSLPPTSMRQTSSPPGRNVHHAAAGDMGAPTFHDGGAAAGLPASLHAHHVQQQRLQKHNQTIHQRFEVLRRSQHIPRPLLDVLSGIVEDVTGHNSVFNDLRTRVSIMETVAVRPSNELSAIRNETVTELQKIQSNVLQLELSLRQKVQTMMVELEEKEMRFNRSVSEMREEHRAALEGAAVFLEEVTKDAERRVYMAAEAASAKATAAISTVREGCERQSALVIAARGVEECGKLTRRLESVVDGVQEKFEDSLTQFRTELRATVSDAETRFLEKAAHQTRLVHQAMDTLNGLPLLECHRLDGSVSFLENRVELLELRGGGGGDILGGEGGGAGADWRREMARIGHETSKTALKLQQFVEGFEGRTLHVVRKGWDYLRQGSGGGVDVAPAASLRHSYGGGENGERRDGGGQRTPVRELRPTTATPSPPPAGGGGGARYAGASPPPLASMIAPPARLHKAQTSMDPREIMMMSASRRLGGDGERLSPPRNGAWDEKMQPVTGRNSHYYASSASDQNVVAASTMAATHVAARVQDRVDAVELQMADLRTSLADDRHGINNLASFIRDAIVDRLDLIQRSVRSVMHVFGLHEATLLRMLELDEALSPPDGGVDDDFSRGGDTKGAAGPAAASSSSMRAGGQSTQKEQSSSALIAAMNRAAYLLTLPIFRGLASRPPPLGVELCDGGPVFGGVDVARVAPSGIAHRCGLQSGDTIVSVNGTPIATRREFRFFVATATAPPSGNLLDVLGAPSQQGGARLPDAHHHRVHPGPTATNNRFSETAPASVSDRVGGGWREDRSDIRDRNSFGEGRSPWTDGGAILLDDHDAPAVALRSENDAAPTALATTAAQPSAMVNCHRLHLKLDVYRPRTASVLHLELDSDMP